MKQKSFNKLIKVFKCSTHNAISFCKFLNSTPELVPKVVISG